MTTTAQRVVPPTSHAERIAEKRIAENPATIMIAASTGMGTWPTSRAATRMTSSMKSPWKTPTVNTFGVVLLIAAAKALSRDNSFDFLVPAAADVPGSDEHTPSEDRRP